MLPDTNEQATTNNQAKKQANERDVGRSGIILEHSGRVVERSGLVLELSDASWGHSEAFSERSGAFWARSGAFWRVLGVFCIILGPNKSLARAQHTNGARNIEIVRARAMSHPWGRARVSLRALSRVPPLGKIGFSRASETAHCEKRDFLSRRFLFRNDPKTPYRPKQFQIKKGMWRRSICRRGTSLTLKPKP